MAKMFAVIVAIYAVFGRYPILNAVIAILALTVLYIVGVFFPAIRDNLLLYLLGLEW